MFMRGNFFMNGELYHGKYIVFLYIAVCPLGLLYRRIENNSKFQSNMEAKAHNY